MASAETHSITAGESDRGERLDRFLAARLNGLSRTRVKALVESGQASRDGTPTRDPSEAIRPGATYALTVPAPKPAAPQAQDIPLDILFEDRDLIVLDKPAGLVVHPAPGHADGTLVNALLGHAGDELEGIGGEARPGIVHRLDKDTSGIMVVAKTQAAHEALSAAFLHRDLDREYQALVWGLPRPAEGEVEAAIGRHPTDRKRMAVVERGGARQGKHAVTRYATLESLHGAAALVRCKLLTGRTHQIRVHLAHLGHPLIGDPVYLRRIPAAAKGLPEAAREAALAFPRQALHAASLRFNHPVSRNLLEFSSAPPADFQGLLETLRA